VVLKTYYTDPMGALTTFLRPSKFGVSDGMFDPSSLPVVLALAALATLVAAWLLKRRSDRGIKKRVTILPQEPKIDTDSPIEIEVKDFDDNDDDETVIANTTEVVHKLLEKHIRRGWAPIRIEVYPKGPWPIPPPPLDPELDVQEPKVIYYGLFPKAFSKFYEVDPRTDSEMWPGRGGSRIKLTLDSALVRALGGLERESYGQNLTEEEVSVLKSGLADTALLEKLWFRGPTLNELAESVILARTEELARTIESNLDSWKKDISVRVRRLVDSGHALTVADLEKVTDLGAGTFSSIREAIALIELQSKLVGKPETIPPPPTE